MPKKKQIELRIGTVLAPKGNGSEWIVIAGIVKFNSEIDVTYLVKKLNGEYSAHLTPQEIEMYYIPKYYTNISEILYAAY